MMFAPASDAEAGDRPLLGAELHKIVGDPALKQRFAGIGFDPTPITADEVAAAMRKTEPTGAGDQAAQHQARLIAGSSPTRGPAGARHRAKLTCHLVAATVG